MACVYVLTNMSNGRQYVGKTVQSFDVRWGGHVGSARRGDNGMLICRAIRKHGPAAFDRRIIEECDVTIVGARETYWIKELKTHVSQGGYNLTYGGDGGLLGYEFSDASRQRIREKSLGRKHSAETRAKISAAHAGRVQDADVIKARARSNRGKKRSAEQRIRISESLKGRVVSDETRIRISLANRGRIMSETTKRKLSKSVEQLHHDGTLVAVHESLTQAARVAGLSKGAMSGVVRNSNRQVNGFIWRYVQE